MNVKTNFVFGNIWLKFLTNDMLNMSGGNECDFTWLSKVDDK